MQQEQRRRSYAGGFRWGGGLAPKPLMVWYGIVNVDLYSAITDNIFLQNGISTGHLLDTV